MGGLARESEASRKKGTGNKRLDVCEEKGQMDGQEEPVVPMGRQEKTRRHTPTPVGGKTVRFDTGTFLSSLFSVHVVVCKGSSGALGRREVRSSQRRDVPDRQLPVMTTELMVFAQPSGQLQVLF